MVSNENPSSEKPTDSASPVDGILVSEQEGGGDPDSALGNESTLVTAELVDESPVAALPAVKSDDNLLQANLAANGGAVASVVLGAMSIIGASVTSYSVINALLGLMLGLWGMSSNVRWPWLGLMLSLVGIFACLIAATGR